MTVGLDQRSRSLQNRYSTPERTLTCVRWGMAVTYSRYKFVTVSLPNGTWRSFHF
jgi:hypothetical protein